MGANRGNKERAAGSSSRAQNLMRALAASQVTLSAEDAKFIRDRDEWHVKAARSKRVLGGPGKSSRPEACD